MPHQPRPVARTTRAGTSGPPVAASRSHTGIEGNARPGLNRRPTAPAATSRMSGKSGSSQNTGEVRLVPASPIASTTTAVPRKASRDGSSSRLPAVRDKAAHMMTAARISAPAAPCAAPCAAPPSKNQVPATATACQRPSPRTVAATRNTAVTNRHAATLRAINRATVQSSSLPSGNGVSRPTAIRTPASAGTADRFDSQRRINKQHTRAAARRHDPHGVAAHAAAKAASDTAAASRVRRR